MGKAPQYDLEEIQRVAITGNLNINTSDKVDTDIVNLDYSMEEVLKCILSLSSKHYQKTIPYSIGNKSINCDVYHMDYFGPDGQIDSLYIKFSYSSTWMTIYSFHL